MSAQVDELREAAVICNLAGERVTAKLLREAADTIESLRDRLQPVPAELDYIEDKSRWFELFGMPERAAQTLAIGDRHADCSECVIRETCYSSDVGCLVEEPDMLLEWLESEVRDD